LSTARLPVLLALILATASPAWALDSERLNRELLKLDPVTRLEQACDTEVMLRINKENRDYSVDKVIAYTFTNPTIGPNSIKAPGAALRSRGTWYHLSFYCETEAEHLDAKKLSYEIGTAIPREDWEQYYLYD
jgi:hypothetical protein